MPAIDNPYYSSEHHGDYDLVSVGRLDLEEGGSIPDCQRAVITLGMLNEAKDHAVLVSTWYSGSHRTGVRMRRPPGALAP